MCGIFCAISPSRFCELNAAATLLLSRRGPDACDTHKIEVQAVPQRWYLTFAASVLSLRGTQIQRQPVFDDKTGSVFCWNGEAWLLKGDEIAVNDTQVIFNHVLEVSGKLQGHTRSEAIIRALSDIKGPFAFVYYDAPACRLYYGRDVLGRRSLLVNHLSQEANELTISSAAFKKQSQGFAEVQVPYIFTIDLNQPVLIPESLTFDFWSPNLNQNVPEYPASLPALPSGDAVDSLLKQLETSVRLRVQSIPTYTRLDATSNPSRVAVLFSGGLDCTLLARLAHDILPVDEPIDLLNVAFENPRVINARANENIAKTGQNNNGYESCPDRLTGRSSFQELSKICSAREWRFVAVDVPYKVFLEHRQCIIQLMYPHNTEMDLSITAALYFAARGQGKLSSNNHEPVTMYTTSARVLLSGLGADELFAGYARHAAAFARGSYAELNEELTLDYKRIGSRNLGRDDRVITHWAKETRYPFLDEDFVEFALGLPSWEKCGFRPDKAIPKHFETTSLVKKKEDLHPEKLLLRCALWQLGMTKAAAEKKRAIQFGARTAKMHAGKTKGTDLVA